MREFDNRWQQCAARARQAEPRETSVPFGFAPRVVARAFAGAEPLPEDLFGQLAFRMLGGAVAVLILCAVLEAPHLRGSRPLETGVENAVAQVVWAL